MPGVDQTAPEAIHIDDKKNEFKRPPSCVSLKRILPDAPFEHRKFSVESLKEIELIGPSK